MGAVESSPTGGSIPATVLHVPVAAGADAEVMAGRLWDLGAIAIEERSGSDGDGPVVLIAGFPTAAAVVAAQSAIAGSSVAEIGDESWRDAWREHAQPVDTGERLRVVPAWRRQEATVPSGRFAISIDPGSCFGSGSHPTTRMLLTLLERVVDEACAPTVLDVGTGSGILAVAAARLGAGRVTAIDIDPASPSVTLANAAVNGVADRIQASTTPLEALPADERFDVVVANLSAATIAELAPALIAHTAAGGILLLSGLLPGQWQHLSSLFGAGSQIINQDGWLAVHTDP